MDVPSDDGLASLAQRSPSRLRDPHQHHQHGNKKRDSGYSGEEHAQLMIPMQQQDSKNDVVVIKDDTIQIEIAEHEEYEYGEHPVAGERQHGTTSKRHKRSSSSSSSSKLRKHKEAEIPEAGTGMDAVMDIDGGEQDVEKELLEAGTSMGRPSRSSKRKTTTTTQQQQQQQQAATSSRASPKRNTAVAATKASKLASSGVRTNHSKDVVDHLIQWLADHTDNPYPTEPEKKVLMQQTGLNLRQINDWYINARRRVLPRMILAEIEAEEQAAAALAAAEAEAAASKASNKSSGGNKGGSSKVVKGDK